MPQTKKVKVPTSKPTKASAQTTTKRNKSGLQSTVKSRAAKKAPTKRPVSKHGRTTLAKRKKASAITSFHLKVFGSALVVVALGFGYFSITHITNVHAASMNDTQGVVGSIGGKCVDNQYNRRVQGNIIQLYTCNGTDAQKWTLHSNNTITNANGYCLDVIHASKKEYTYVQLWHCNGTVAQKWTIKDGKYLVNTNTGYCMTAHFNAPINGTRYWMKGCHASPAQTYQLPTAPISKETVANPATPPSASGATSNPGPVAASSGGVQLTGSGITPYQNLSGSTFSKIVNSAGSNAVVSLQPRTYAFSDFGDGTQAVAQQNSAYGAALSVRGLIGAGSDYTTIQMNPNTSRKAGDVPPSCGGGTSCPTNNLYLVRVTGANAKVDGVRIQGTNQGHLYNGLRYEYVSNPTLSNAVVAGIPGNSSGNPGETFAVNLQHASGTATISNVTIDGGGVGAAGIAANSSSATINVNNLRAVNLRYSAGIALWQQTGTVNLHGYTSQNNARSLGAERLGATVNIYDPNWSIPSSGHDITYTPYSGYASRINFYFSSTSKVPTRKIVILTNTAALKSTVHVYVNNTEQNASNYVSWQGA